MKDLRGSSVSAVRSTIFRTFRLQPTNKGRKNSSDFIEWKNSKEVAESYNQLFSGENMLEKLTTSAFPSSEDMSDEQFSDFYIYTASVSDIILNPKYTAPEVSRKPLELRLRRFKVFIDFFFHYLKNLFIKPKLNVLDMSRYKKPNRP